MMTTANNNNQMISDSAGVCPRVSPQTATPTTEDPSSSWPNFVSPTSSGASTASTTTNIASKRYRAGQEIAAPSAVVGPSTGFAASWHAGTPFPPQAAAAAAHPQHYQAAAGAAAMVIPNHYQQDHHQQESNSKRRRDASYFPAREVPKTLISSMGSLAAGGRGAAPGNLRANLRQQLSGSNLMEFLGNHNDNAMDVEDHHHERPRSMSF